MNTLMNTQINPSPEQTVSTRQETATIADLQHSELLTRTIRESESQRPQQSKQIVQGLVVEATSTGEWVVQLTDSMRQIRCGILQNAEQLSFRYRSGDHVLVFLNHPDDLNGCILGRVGINRDSAEETEKKKTILSVEGELEIRCGKASITLREDGKVLIEGVDVVSRASESQRIKGSSVRIN